MTVKRENVACSPFSRVFLASIFATRYVPGFFAGSTVRCLPARKKAREFPACTTNNFTAALPELLRGQVYYRYEEAMAPKP